jgi:23S rRNA pseudouridine1911/1915/1917 synthase
MNTYTYNEEEPSRLDQFLADVSERTRAQVKKDIDGGLVLLNGKQPKKAGSKISQGDVITVEDRPVVTKQDVIEEAIVPTEVDVVAETDTYLVVNKPAGLLVHPTEAEEPVTMASILLEQYPMLRGVGENPIRPGIVHRLDKEASGLLVVAKTQQMYEHLKAQFMDRTIDKEYRVLVHGQIDAEHLDIDFDIDRGHGGKMVARPKTDLLSLKSVGDAQPGKDAHTEAWPLDMRINHTLLKVKIHTGRTHQIRVHMFAYGHPVVGDTLYFNKKYRSDLDRLFLHSARLQFEDLEGNRPEFTLELPPELDAYLAQAT